MSIGFSTVFFSAEDFPRRARVCDLFCLFQADGREETPGITYMGPTVLIPAKMRNQFGKRFLPALGSAALPQDFPN